MVSIIVVTKNSRTLDKCIATIQKNTFVKHEIIVVNAGEPIERMEGVVIVNGGDMITSQIKLGYEASKGDFVTAFCDDHFPIMFWLTEAKMCFDKFFKDGYGMVCLNEMRNWKGSKACVTLTTKKFIEEKLNGIWYDTAFKHYFCDDDLYFRAKDKGYVYCETAKVFHDHKGKNIMELWKPDEDEFKRRGYGKG